MDNRQGQLPTWQEFLQRLAPVAAATLSRDDRCIFCHQTFSETHDALYHTVDGITPDRTIMSAFMELPFSHRSAPQLCTPLQLPCGHVSGSCGFARWFSTSDRNTCPQCMRPLFVQGTVPPPTNFDHRLQQAEARVLRLPLRRLLVDHRTWTNDQVLLITDPDIDRFRLMKIMADVATRLDGGNVSERAWMLPPSNYLRGHTPDHTGEVFDSETKYMSNSEYFWAQVIRLDKYCPREVYGITSKRRLLLFSAETQTMFHGILAGTWGYRDACLIHGEYASPETCANRIIDAVQGLWNQDWNTTIWPPLYQFLDLTVKTWIGQIRLINGAKGGIIRITLPTDDTASNSSESDGDEYTDIWL